MNSSKSPYITLSDGNKMPMLGFGCSRFDNDDVAYRSVTTAIQEGYRLFGTSPLYPGERSVGQALRDSGMKREEYFVITLHTKWHGYEEAKQSVANTLETMGLDYVNLLLIHSPRPGRVVETWRAVVDLKKEGKTKSIGVSNFNREHIAGLEKYGMEKPVLNEIEVFPLNQQADTVAFCRNNNIAIVGYSPLGRCRYFADGEVPVVDAIASRLNKTKAQVFLRWAVQCGVTPIPKSSNVARIKENIDIFDWSISEEDMKLLSTIDRKAEVSPACKSMHMSWEFLEGINEKGVW